MKIFNTQKGEAYQLTDGTAIEIERTNPFFNDYGEQSVPIDLPASDHNRRLLGFPEQFGRRERMLVTEAAIQDGEYFTHCRQFVHSAQKGGTINTTFYINDGAFYSRIHDYRLKELFLDDIRTFGSTPSALTAARTYCRTLREGNDEKFAIFPVLVTDDSGNNTGFNYKILNAFGKNITRRAYLREGFGSSEHIPHEDVTYFDPDEMGTGCGFYNDVQRLEYVNGVPITLPEGYYISPFVKVKYVLKKLFAHFGYELQPSFLTDTHPFSGLVLLNSVIDPIVNGRIVTADLLPDATVGDFLAVIRRKFCCEFVADEHKRTISVVTMPEALTMRPQCDLSKHLTEEPVMEFRSEKDFKRIRLSSQTTLDSDAEGSYDNLKQMALDCPGAYMDVYTGSFYKDGFSGDYKVTTKIAGASMPYDTGEDLDTEDIEIPDCVPEFRTLLYKGNIDGEEYEKKIGSWLYVGNYVTINSKLELAGEDNIEADNNNTSMPVMLAFSFMAAAGKPEGTVSAYDRSGSRQGMWGAPRTASAPVKISDYALHYNGTDGIFERFWRNTDFLQRNALQPLKVKLLLSSSQKLNLKAFAKVIVRGVPYFFNKLKFTLGGEESPQESELLSVMPALPSEEAPDIEDILPMISSPYRWAGHSTIEQATKTQYENSGPDKERTFRMVYPPVPTAQMAGTRYMEQTSFTKESHEEKKLFFWRKAVYEYQKTTTWLTVESR